MHQSQIAGRTIILATQNPAKLSLYEQAFAGFGWQALGLRQLGIDVALQEGGETPEANALLKAEAAWKPGRTVFAEDSGLEVDALHGEPGVQTRRWNGRFSDDVADDVWLEYLLARLKGVPLSQRTARFVTGWALVDRNGQADVKRMTTPFLIALQPQFPMIPGWPMSAVHIRLPEAEQDVDRLVCREFSNWPFFQRQTRETF